MRPISISSKVLTEMPPKLKARKVMPLSSLTALDFQQLCHKRKKKSSMPLISINRKLSAQTPQTEKSLSSLPLFFNLCHQLFILFRRMKLFQQIRAASHGAAEGFFAPPSGDFRMVAGK